MCNKVRAKLPRTVLPTLVQATKYKSHFEPCLKTFSFTGHQTVSLNVNSAVRSIILHAKDILVESPVSYIDCNGETVVSSSLTMNSVDSTLKMEFPTDLPVGTGSLKMNFHGTLNDQMAGFYRSGYLDLHGKKQYMGTTQMEPIDARRMFPCVDEPAAKAVFELSVSVPADLMVLSNMPESKKTLRLSGEPTGNVLMQDVEFMPTPKMSSYLVAMCIGHFEFVQATTKRGTLVRVLATPGKANQCEFALDVGVRCLEFYEDFFALDYPLPKLDMIGVPDFSMGAMENWGLVTYREIDLLCDPKTVSALRMQRLASVVTHELAHQWFGNLVTMEWWDDLWLNEGFATFMQTLSADALFPEWKLWDQYISDDLDRARSLDGLRSSHPVQVPIPKAEDVEQVFDAISYSKGCCVVRVIYHVLGAEKFKAGIRQYMKRHAMGNTVTDDLWTALEEAKGPSQGWTVGELMGSWTQQMGYPVLKVKLSADRKSLVINQDWFLADGSKRAGDDEPVWMVPVFVGSSAKTGVAEMHIIKDKQSTIPIPEGLDLSNPSSWLKVNFGEIVPIRVQYESRELLDALLRNSASLCVVDRVGLLSDARALTRAGLMNIGQVLAILKSYKAEANCDVWSGIESTVANIEKIVASLGKADDLARLVMALVRPQLDRIGWDPKETDRDGEKRMRACLFRLLSSFATGAESSDIRTEAIRRFTEFQAEPNTSLIVDDTRTAIYRLALAAPESADEGRAAWTFLKQLAEDPQCTQTHKLNIYSALGFVRNASLKKATLDWTLTKHIKTQDFFYPIGAVRTSNSQGSEIAWEWIKLSFPLCRERLAKASPSLLASVINQACAGNVLASRADEIEKSYGGIQNISRIIAQLVESVRSNASFLERETANKSINTSGLFDINQ